ncbi:hypothetical protein [Geminisphaera colitermitum]|uniref:hypothetical protein n=1 Tax=Geminisphaera colitermitum TaxID=1148786 RepID=UPI000158D5F6|nr:hypothetical protein [Geminisphaera colitermitum]
MIKPSSTFALTYAAASTVLLAATAVRGDGSISATADLRIRSPFVKRAVNTPAGSYYTYPHSNGFWRSDPTWDASTFIVGRETEATNTLSLIEFDPTTGQHRAAGALENANMFYSISGNGLAVVSTKRSDNALVLLDLTRRQPNRILTTAPAGTQISHGADIREDGTEATYALWNVKAEGGNQKLFQLQTINIATGVVTTRMETDWIINHAHYSPSDPKWISFSHEVPGGGPLPDDRMWAWHEIEAPHGRRLFRPQSPIGDFIYMNHERALFHKPGVVSVVMTSRNSGGADGLYEVGYDGSHRLITGGKGFYHCNISRDGRWMVADIILPDNRTEVIALNFKTGARETLYVGGRAKHPWHAHPHISPDGRWVILNDSGIRSAVALEIDHARLEAFLK